MAITLDTTTIPGQTIVTDSNGGVAIDYSAVYERIATALETIATSVGSDSTTISGKMGENVQALENITQALQSSSVSQELNDIRTLLESGNAKISDPLAWMGLMSVYKLYVEDPGAIGIEELKAYKAKIDALVASLE
jgi:hypothetical protein